MRKLLLLAVVGALAGCADQGDTASEKSGEGFDSASMPPAPSRTFTSPDTTSPPPVPPSAAVWVRVKNDTLTIANTYLRTGEVTIAILNEDDEVHTIEISSGRARWKTIPIRPGNDATLTVRLDPTEHEVYCVEPKHRENGEHLKFKVVTEQD